MASELRLCFPIWACPPTASPLSEIWRYFRAHNGWQLQFNLGIDTRSFTLWAEVRNALLR
jgi:hypothetical protein